MTVTDLQSGARSSAPRAVKPDVDALIVVIRTPKAASTSLAAIVEQAFPAAHAFVLPNTLDLEGSISALQHLRHIRHAAQINFRSHRLLRLSQVFARINARAVPGDILTGGHLDFETCRSRLAMPAKFITLVRNPIERALSEYTYARVGFRRKSYFAKLDASLVAKAAGRHSFEGYLDFLIDHRATFGDLACRYVGLRPGDDIERHFAAHAYHFGTVDNLPAFARGLVRKGGKAVLEQHLNPTGGPMRLKVTTAEQRKIEQLYPGDLALYEWVRAQEAPAVRQQQRPALTLVAATA